MPETTACRCTCSTRSPTCSPASAAATACSCLPTSTARSSRSSTTRGSSKWLPRLDQLAHEFYRRFNDVAPFIPLWQVDRHMVISTAVKLSPTGPTDDETFRLLDPATLFNEVGQWRVD
ncbi:hypothetical protein [Fimbriiglobus ruber]|uniref:Uncharacterized protein n=1 Tax=Fimbriiglobus ruber TaxID=1908690 RepID=A0A225DHB4_9BACT|nr:hypothetical protein [Fimbriiglobus ruber]OWK36599.1 hypothetical protein FRUB_09162 [Fimbriiglobus ruber]